MILFDVNVLVYAFREDSPQHIRYKKWLLDVVGGNSAYGVSELVLSGFIRVVTHPRVFNPPSPVETALVFASEVRGQPNCMIVHPGPRHWDIFADLCRRTKVKGNLIPDAYLAALAIESGSEWITTDSDFARFPGLRWRHPLS